MSNNIAKRKVLLVGGPLSTFREWSCRSLIGSVVSSAPLKVGHLECSVRPVQYGNEAAQLLRTDLLRAKCGFAPKVHAGTRPQKHCLLSHHRADQAPPLPSSTIAQ